MIARTNHQIKVQLRFLENALTQEYVDAQVTFVYRSDVRREQGALVELKLTYRNRRIYCHNP